MHCGCMQHHEYKILRRLHKLRVLKTLAPRAYSLQTLDARDITSLYFLHRLESLA